MADPSRNRPPGAASNGRTPTPGNVPNPAPRRNTPAPTGAQRTNPPTGARPTSSGARPSGPPPRTPPPGAPRPGAGRPAPATRPTGASARRTGPPPKPTGVTGMLNSFLDSMGIERYSPMRYVIIWVPIVIVILAVLLLMIYMNSGSTKAPNAVAGGTTGGALPQFMNVQTDKGLIKIKMDTDPADKVVDVVKNFTDKAAAGYFDGKVFHRVENWVIQGGDPLGNGQGGGSITAEYNSKSFTRGAVGVASTAGGGPQINDSQWFIVKTDATYLNTQYSYIGMVTQGMDVVDKIAIGDKMTKVTVSDQ